MARVAVSELRPGDKILVPHCGATVVGLHPRGKRARAVEMRYPGGETDAPIWASDARLVVERTRR